MSAKAIPQFTASGTVVHGHGRGGTQLGYPTANLDTAAVSTVTLDDGVFCGYARVDGGKFYPMVMSTGWNPTFQDPTRSAEVHILEKFPSDFYGSKIDIDVRAWLRPQRKFSSLEELITAIEADITNARAFLADHPPSSE